MKSFTRRSVVKGALVCSASAAFATGLPQATFPVDPRARIAVATYPFRESIIAPGNQDRDPKKPGMDLASFARFVRTEFGVNGIEPLNSHFTSTEPDEIRKLRAAFDAAGVHTVNIPVDEKVELCSDDEAKRNAGNARYRHWIDVARAAWIPQHSRLDSQVLRSLLIFPGRYGRSSRRLITQPRATSLSILRMTIRCPLLPREASRPSSWPILPI